MTTDEAASRFAKALRDAGYAAWNRPPGGLELGPDGRYRAKETWVCDSCMRRVTRGQIADMADCEHVLCKVCFDS